MNKALLQLTVNRCRCRAQGSYSEVPCCVLDTAGVRDGDMSSVTDCKRLRCACVARKGFQDIMEAVVYFRCGDWVCSVMSCAGPQLPDVTKLATYKAAPYLNEGLWCVVSVLCVAAEHLMAARAELEDTAR